MTDGTDDKPDYCTAAEWSELVAAARLYHGQGRISGAGISRVLGVPVAAVYAFLAAGRPVCRHCRRMRATRPRGLCYHCYRDTGVRAGYGSEHKCGAWADAVRRAVASSVPSNPGG